MHRLRPARFISSLPLAALALATAAAQPPSVTSEVDPFIGTTLSDARPHPSIGSNYNGNTFPGAAYPMGMVQWSPDTPGAKPVKGGYWYPDHVITGFTLTHFSGRGVTYLQDFPFMPTTKAVAGSPGTHWGDFAAAFSHDREIAHPGYYSVRLDDGIRAQFTVTARTGLCRLTFPQGARQVVLFRTDTRVDLADREISGWHVATAGTKERHFTIYFAAKFDRPFATAGVWSGDAFFPGRKSADGSSCGAAVTFDPGSGDVVRVKVGISFVSVAGARANLAAEDPGWDFGAVRRRADQAWNDALGRIQVAGGSPAETRIFTTALYHCFFHPNLLSDADGRYPGMDGRLHTVAAGHEQVQNIPGWDQYRSFAALRAILTPRESSDIAQSLVNFARQDRAVRPDGGGFPRWEQGNHNSGGMVGDGDDAILAADYAFGARDFDTSAALAIMKRDASVPGVTSDGFPVRAGLAEELALGYVPGKAAVTEEYCTADFALAQFAGALGDRAAETLYQARAQDWRHLFNPATGYLQPRERDGSFRPGFNPALTVGYVEGSAAQYFWLVPFDYRGLFSLIGGDAGAVARLDRYFSALDGPPRTGHAYMGNEPCEVDPWAYDFAGAPAKTQGVVRRIQLQLFRDSPGGLPGNDDAGAISSWYVFSALGLYPAIPGVGGLVVGSPMFPSAAVRLPGGQTIRIEAVGAAPDAPYVQSLTLDGRPWTSTWIPWKLLAHGATLRFVLGKQPSGWGSAKGDAPPSFGAAGG
jgi:predicted alpha-1,2-mannosidase